MEYHIKQALSGGLAASLSLTVTYPLYNAVVGTQVGELSTEKSILERIRDLWRAGDLYTGLRSALFATGIQSTL